MPVPEGCGKDPCPVPDGPREAEGITPVGTPPDGTDPLGTA